MTNETKKTKHTPGPWKMKKITHGAAGALVYFVLKAEGVSVAGTSVYVGETNGSTRQISDAECEANARLIAAAPDLFAALKALALWEQQDGKQIPDETPSYDATLKMVRAAVTKAGAR